MVYEFDWNTIANHRNDSRLVQIPTTQIIHGDELLSRFPKGDIYVCDAYIKDIELEGREVAGGLQWGRFINIDHHAPIDSMTKPISSTPLAMQRVREHGPARGEDYVIINHTDCDSVLSAAIMLGILPPKEEFAQAAIAADHTGQANDIADLLQPATKFKDFALSLQSLVNFMTSQPLNEAVEKAMRQRLSDREKAKNLIQNNQYTMMPGGVAWLLLPERMDGALFPSLLPQAKVIVQINPIQNTHQHRMAIRLGQSAPQGASLHQLNITELDPAYGGRWNAGNNSRAGGSALPPEEYVQRLDQRVSQVFG